jgi:predicted TIM-barrel fold metal-dependent hydrolase
MLTRRQWLALMPVSLTAAQSAGPIERIDTHVHLNRMSRPMIAGLQSSGWKVLSICVSRATGDDPSDVDSQIRGNAELSRESGGRVSWAGSFDARHWQDADFATKTIAALQQQFRDGAIAVKIWKNIGMSLRDKTGRYVLPDDPVFHPIYGMLQKEGRTLIAHLAEPNGAWMPIDEHNPEKGFYSSHPEWHMYGKPGTPSKEAILQSRDRIAARFPKLRVLGCHLGSNEEDLPALSARLNRFPNFAVDLAARIRYFAGGDREKARAFLIKYQDRITYGTDFSLAPGADEQRASENLAAQHDRDWRYLSTSDVMTYNRMEVRGLGLPSGAVDQIFRKNAVRWLPGIE